MSVIFLLLIASLSVACFFLLAYWWSIKDGQFEDTYSPGQRILYEGMRKGERGMRKEE